MPLLERDPTGVSQEKLFPGFFAIPGAAEMNSYDGQNRLETSLEFVSKKFNPQFIGVSEIPLAVCTALYNASLAEIEHFNTELARTGKVDLPYKEVELQIQIELLQVFVQSPTRYLLATPSS